jgi:hypothetical protein
MPITIPLSPVTAGTLIYGDEFQQGTPIVNAIITFRQIPGGILATPSVSVGGLSWATRTDALGHWSTMLVPSSALTPNDIIEITTPTMGAFRIVPPTPPGSYEAILLRDNTK